MEIYKITADSHIDPSLQANSNLISSIKFASSLHYHDYYEFFLITKGSCLHRVNDGTQHLKEGALVFIRPDDKHFYDCDGEEDCEFINIACTKEIIGSLFKYLESDCFINILLKSPMPPCSLLSQPEKEDFVAAYEKIKMLGTIDSEHSKLQLKGLLVDIFTQYFSSEPINESNKLPHWLGSLLTQMQKEENFTLGLDKLYELSGRSVGHLNRVFRQYLSVTPTLYINQLRLDFAKSLLTTTNLSIVDISMDAGFENLSHFYHLFKSRFGQTPSRFRKTRTLI
jgi:AraC family cel operon transcriptional repressor